MDIRRLAKRAIEKSGYLIAPREHVADLVLVEALRRLKPRMVLDVGANRGQFHDFLRNVVRYQGPIISFEPNPVDFDYLQSRPERDWQVFPYAIGSKDEAKSLNVTDRSVFSSFHQMRSDGHPFTDVVVSAQAIVEVRRLDRLLTELGIDVTGALLKTDTQGFDLEVIRGAPTEVLAAIQFEASQIPIYEGAPDMLDVIREVRALGFNLAVMAPLTTEGPAIHEFDCLMTRG